jgi:hypothetical protein
VYDQLVKTKPSDRCKVFDRQARGRGKESYIGQLGYLFLPFWKNYVQNLLPAGPFSQVFILDLNVFLIHLELKDL